MTHEEVAPLLPDLLEGRLPDPLRADVEAHAAACEECRALVESYGVLAEGFRAAAAGAAEGHASVEALVEFVLGPEGGSGPDRREIGAHLDACPRCAGEVEAVRRSQAEAGTGRGRPAFLGGRGTWAAWRPEIRASLAAAVVLVVLAYPAYLGVRELPRVRQASEALVAAGEAARAEADALRRSLERSESERHRVAGWTGAITVPLIAAPARGGSADEVVIPLAEGQPFVCLAVDPGVPDPTAGVRAYRAEILALDGTEAWSLEMDPAELRSHLAAAGSLVFLVPSEALPPGSYRLRITREGPTAPGRLLEVPIAIVRPEAPPGGQRPIASPRPR